MEAERAANFREQGMVDEELIRFRSLHERGLMEKKAASAHWSVRPRISTVILAG